MASERRYIWWDRLFTIFTLLLGAGLAIGADYWKTFVYTKVDTKVHILQSSFQTDKLTLRIAVINYGNRQGIVADLQVLFPITSSSGYEGYVEPKESKTERTPILLNSGEMRLLTLEYILPMEEMYKKSYSTDPAEVPISYYQGPEIRKFDLKLFTRAINFKGERYERFFEIRINTA